MKIIFLDIDGPLAWATWLDGRVKIKDDLTIRYPWLQEECDALSRILYATDAKIVLSSDWRLYYSIEQMHAIFTHYGIPNVIIDYTSPYKVKMSSSGRMDRAKQILNWVEENNPESWVAIDDYDLEYEFFSEGYNDNYIATVGDNSSVLDTISLREYDIINMLNKKEGDAIF